MVSPKVDRLVSARPEKIATYELDSAGLVYSDGSGKPLFDLDLGKGVTAPAPQAAAPVSGMMDFNLGDLNLDLGGKNGEAVTAAGYEIHHGQTAQHPAMAAKGDIAREVMPGLAWQNAAGNVLGCYLHGLFEDPAVLRALFGTRVPTLDTVFDGLADFLEQHVEPGVLDALIYKD